MILTGLDGTPLTSMTTCTEKDSKDAAHSGRKMHIPGTPAARGYQATKDGIVAAAQEPDTTQNANHVYIYDPELPKSKLHYPDWVTQGQTTTIAGPFTNEAGGGDVPRGHDVFIITINDRNMRHFHHT